MSVVAEKVPTSAKVGFGAWRIFPRSLAVELEEWLEECLRDEPPKVILPHQYAKSDGWRGKPVDDPLTIYVALPVGATEGDEPLWSVNLSDLIQDFIEWGDDCRIAALRNSLAGQVEKLDTVIAKTKKEQGSAQDSAS